MKTQLTCFALGLVFLFGLVGCTVGPDYQLPEMETPDQWRDPSSENLTVLSDPNLQTWWTVFNDPQLNELIRRAVDNNRDLQGAVARVDAARALRDYATGRYFPEVDAVGAYSRSQASKNGAVLYPEQPDPINLHSAGFEASWEIDLFGRIRRTNEAAQAEYQASFEDYRQVMVSLLAEVCRNYIDLRTTQARITYAQANIEIQRQTLQLTQSRYAAQIISELDVRQAETNLAATEAQIPLLRIAENDAFNRLAVLVGEMPGALQEEFSSFEQLPILQNDLVIGLPVDLLRRRPDIRQIERQLAAQTARIGVATADLYPSLQLTGSFQIQSQKLSGMGNIHNQAYAFGPSMRWNIFDANRIRSNIKYQEALTQELLAAWQNSVLHAFEEVNNALVSYDQQKQRQAFLQISVTSSQRSVQLTQDQYKSGLTDFENVLLSQRTLSLQQDNLAATDGAVLQALVYLYKSFGVGSPLPPDPQQLP